MITRSMADPVRYATMTTGQIREAFLIDGLCIPGELHQIYIDLDGAVVGMVIPLLNPISLTADETLRAKSFVERRELGVLNIGAGGMIHVGPRELPSRQSRLPICRARRKRDCIRINRSRFSGCLLSSAILPTGSYPTALVRKAEASPVELGSAETCNRRTVCKYIHLEGTQSCQLVMGVTHLHSGSAWNTMPAHTHVRRSEIYMYFNLAKEGRIFHLMGPPEETRHIVMKNRDIVVSPGWSIHAGVGTQAYSFCWGMGGENQDYGDMDPVSLESVR